MRKCKLIYCEKQISVCLGKGGGRNRGRITKEQEESLEGEGLHVRVIFLEVPTEAAGVIEILREKRERRWWPHT